MSKEVNNACIKELVDLLSQVKGMSHFFVIKAQKRLVVIFTNELTIDEAQQVTDAIEKFSPSCELFGLHEFMDSKILVIHLLSDDISDYEFKFGGRFDDGGKVEEIKRKVEERLQESQKTKEFKDIGRVAQTKKEKAAYRLITGSLLSELETDGVMAYNMVKKDAVWPEIDVNKERANGVSSGAAFLKVKIREAVPTRPADDRAKRRTYVLFLEFLQKKLDELKTYEEMKGLRDFFRAMKMDQVIGAFIDPTYLTATPEQKKLIDDTLKKNINFRSAMLFGSSTFTQKLIKEIFSARLENMIFRFSDASAMNWNLAETYEEVTTEQAEQKKIAIQNRLKSFTAANEERIAKYKGYSWEELRKMMESEWQIGPGNKKRYKDDPEEFRKFAVDYLERKIKSETDLLSKRIEAIKARPQDWSWFDSPKQKAESDKPKSKAINTKPPLSYIKRTGGYKIETISPQEIVDKFGFHAVNYGVYVDDKWSKEHTKHFLESISDLGEMTNLDIKGINQLGKLSIAFGAKGRAGHLATYFPQTKDINLTKGNGDGSVAHEWGHYFDNVIVEQDLKRAINSFASQGRMEDFEIKALFAELMNFFHKGAEGVTPKVPMKFYAKKTDLPPTYSRYVDGSWTSGPIAIKSTIEESLLQVMDLAKVDQGIYQTQIRIFGYIIDQHGLESYDIPMKLKTSHFYFKSAYMIFDYCHPNPKGEGYVIGAWPRTQYWTSDVELFARAWETVILKKLTDKGRSSNYLVADISLDDVVQEGIFMEPYPTGAELQHIESIMDRIILAVKKRFSIGDFIPPSSVREDEYLELGKTGKVTAGMEVTKGKVEFVGQEAEAIETLEMLIRIGGTEVQMKEWKYAISQISKGAGKTQKEYETGILYHGTSRKFDKFKLESDISSPLYGTDASDNGLGIFFTENKTMAKQFAGTEEYDSDKEKYVSTGKAGNIVVANIHIKNPWILQEQVKDIDEDDAAQTYFDIVKQYGNGKKMREELSKQGYDAVIVKNVTTNYYEDGHYTIYVVFNPGDIEIISID